MSKGSVPMTCTWAQSQVLGRLADHRLEVAVQLLHKPQPGRSVSADKITVGSNSHSLQALT